MVTYLENEEFFIPKICTAEDEAGHPMYEAMHPNEEMLSSQEVSGLKFTGSPRSVLTKLYSRGSNASNSCCESDDLMSTDILKDEIQIESIEDVKELEAEVSWIQMELAAQDPSTANSERTRVLVELRDELEAELQCIKQYNDLQKELNDQLEEVLSRPNFSSSLYLESDDPVDDDFSLSTGINVHSIEGFDVIRGSDSASPCLPTDDFLDSNFNPREIKDVSDMEAFGSWLDTPDQEPELNDEELETESRKLEQEVDWLHSEVCALRLHLTLLEFKTVSSYKLLMEEGVKEELSDLEIQRMKVLNILKSEIQEEILCTTEIQTLLRERNNQIENNLKVMDQQKERRMLENGLKPLAGISVEKYSEYPVELSMQMVMTMAGIMRRQGCSVSKTEPSTSAPTTSGHESFKKLPSLSSMLSMNFRSRRTPVTGSIGSKAVFKLLGNSDTSEDSPTASSQRFDPYSTREVFSGEVGPYEKFTEVVSLADYKDFKVAEKRQLYKYKTYVDRLKHVNPKKLSHEDRVAFWINLYNAINMHAIIAYGIPSNQSKHVILMQKVSYKIGGMEFNALAMEHAVLRACSSYAPEAGVPYEVRFKEEDERRACALTRSEPLINFALCSGTRSSPALRVFSSHNIHWELRAAAKDYLQASIGLTKNDKVIVPKVLQMYNRDFADNAFLLLEWVAAQLPKALKKEVLVRLPKRVSSAAKSMHVLPYDWNFRYLLP